MLGNKLGFDVEHKEYAGFGNYAQASTNKIEMPQTADINTVIHEIGHVFYNLKYKDGIASSLTHASSYYGIDMAGEVFAENFMHYFIAPDFIKMYLPEVYSDLNKRIPDKWKKEIKILLNKTE